MTERPKQWRDVIFVRDLEKNWVTRVQFEKILLAVYDTSDGIYASIARCTHSGADLCDGYFDGFVIECPLHQGAFDVRDGKPVCAPATRALKIFETRIEGDVVQIFV